MLSAAIHRRLARDYLDRAYRASTRNAKVKYLRLAVRNSMRAQTKEVESLPLNSRNRQGQRGQQKTDGAIVLHIGEQSEMLLPKDPRGRARAIQWLIAALSSIEPRRHDRSLLCE